MAKQQNFTLVVTHTYEYPFANAAEAIEWTEKQYCLNGGKVELKDATGKVIHKTGLNILHK